MVTDGCQATVLLSGGIDSAACAHFLRSRGFLVEGIFIDYGQAAACREADAVQAIASHLAIPVRRVSFSGAETYGSGELVGRNAFLLFAALFVTRGRAGILAVGLHSGSPYYDCSETFVETIGRLIAEHTDGQVSVLAPFLGWTKAEVYDYFVAANLPISATYSCENGTMPICGICASCCDRKRLGC
jgi:7-cyano-7-deazaguanine synthase